MIPPTREAFLKVFTERNRGLIAEIDQRRLASATILVAGCGSTGGAVVEPLVRAGAQRLLLAEPGSFELNNLNRQRGTLEALGCNKAEWLARQAKAVNPHLQISVFTEGISRQNAQRLCQQAELVIDAVDVTTTEGLKAKFLLHEAACQERRPTVCAYDLAYRQYVRIYDYRKLRSVFGGQLEKLRKARTPVEALSQLVPVWAIPYDLLDEIERLLKNPGASISQLGCTADLFGAIMVPLAIELLADRPVKESFTVDLRDTVLPSRRRLVRRLATLKKLIRLKREI